MRENQEIQLTIEVLPVQGNDMPGIAARLRRELDEAAEVQLTANETSKISTRGPDPGLVLQVINVTFAGIGLLIQLAKLLYDISKEKSGNTLIVTNSKTGKAVKLSGTDSLKRIEKKMRKVLDKEKIEMTFKKN